MSANTRKPRKIPARFSNQEREEATKPFQSPEQLLDLIAPLITSPGRIPRGYAGS